MLVELVWVTTVNVNELYKLADWFEDRHSALKKHYQALQSPLQHNATQADKQPLGEPLEALDSHLEEMTFEELSIQQMRLLRTLGVDEFIGQRGKQFINSTVRTSDYDPATAVSEIQRAISKINETHSQLMAYRTAVDALDVDLMEFDEPDDFISIRVGFQNDASINNVTDWKKSASDWYDIIRGLSLASGESPENTRVIGAGTGSLILFLAGTATVTILLAIISKNVSSVAKNVIEIQNETENLRQKRLLTEVMERELSNQAKKLKEGALDTVLAEVRKQIPDLSNEAETALNNSVKKLLAFNEKGGNVDFVAPSEVERTGEDEAEASASATALAQARAAIEEYQAERDAVKLLTDASNDD